MRLLRLQAKDFGPLGRVDLDFDVLRQVAICGRNDVGKSSTLDAVTWGLWGQCRASDDKIVRNGANEVAVELSFEAQGHVYHVRRSYRLTARGTSSLHFERVEHDGTITSLDGKTTTRGEDSTQARIIAALGGVTYDLAINTTFFMQGASGTLANAQPADRRRVLYSLLDLDRFDAMRAKLKDRRFALDAALAKADAEVAYHRERADTIYDAEQASAEAAILAREADERAAKTAAALEGAQKTHRGALDHSAEAGRQVAAAETVRVQETQARAVAGQLRAALEGIEREMQAPAPSVPTDEEIASLREFEDKADANLQAARVAYESASDARVDASEAYAAAKAHAVEADAVGRQAYEAERARLLADVTQARDSLASARAAYEKASWDAMQAHDKRLTDATVATMRAETALQSAEKALAMSEGAARLLGNVPCGGEGTFAACPLLRQAVEARESMPALRQAVEDATAAHKAAKAAHAAIGEYKAPEDVQALAAHAKAAEAGLRTTQGAQGTLAAYVQPPEAVQADEAVLGALRLQTSASEDLDACLAAGKAAKSTHDAAKAARVDAESRADAGRQHAVNRGRLEERREAARVALDESQAKADALQSEYEARRDVASAAHAEAIQAQGVTAEAVQSAHGINGAAQSEAMDARRTSDRAADHLAGIQKSAEIVAGYEAKVAGMRRDLGDVERLEQAYKDAPTLVLETVIPQIEARANDMLASMSPTGHQIRLNTQRASKDGEKVIETLDIVVECGTGTRPYATFGGAARFMVDLALRLGLADVVESRGVASLDTVFIDEGFGAVDAVALDQVVQTLLREAERFGVMAVITHVEEVQDAFPARVEVVGSENGSVVEG